MRTLIGLAVAMVILAPHANAAEGPRNPIFQAAIQYGQQVCSLLRHEATLTALADAEVKLQAKGFTDSEAGAIVGTSVQAYCPEQRAAIVAAVGTN